MYKIKLYNKAGNIVETMAANDHQRALRVAQYWVGCTYKLTKIVRTELVQEFD